MENKKPQFPRIDDLRAAFPDYSILSVGTCWMFKCKWRAGRAKISKNNARLHCGGPQEYIRMALVGLGLDAPESLQVASAAHENRAKAFAERSDIN